MNSRGSSMTMFIGVLLIGAILSLAGLWLYDQREKNDYKATWDAITKANGNYTQATEKFDANVKSMQLAQDKIASLEKMIEAMNQNCNAVHSENTATMKKCADLEQKQIQLQDQLSKKRPVIQLRQPIAVEVTKGSGVKALIKESGKKAKELGQ